MTTDLAQAVDRMLLGGWYSPTESARTATHVLVLAVVQAGFSMPSVQATRWKGTQCDWESRAGCVVVCFDDKGRCSLVIGRHGEDATTCVDIPTNAQIVAALQTL